MYKLKDGKEIIEESICPTFFCPCYSYNKVSGRSIGIMVIRFDYCYRSFGRIDQQEDYP